ncbi:MAG: gluconokinase [Candidatus Dormibacteraceae bacterium]
MTSTTKGSPLVVALDVGTSSVRTLLFNQRARPQPGAEVHLPYRPHVTADGAAEVDAEKLLRLVQRALDGILERAGPGRRERIVAVGISTFWHGLVATDADARPLTPVYLWSDARSWRDAARLRESLDAEAIRQRTGCLIHPSYWPAKLAWLRRQQRPLWSRGVRWLSIGDLLHWRLFGTPRTSLSMASGTGLMGLVERHWDGQLLEALGVAIEALPALAEEERGLRAPYARRWPALAEVPWFTAAGDGALANLGSGCLDPRQRAITVGTSGALRVMGGGPPASIPAGLWCYRLDADRVVMGGALSNGGNLYEWFLRTLALDGGLLERQIAALAPTEHGLTFLPLLAGERSPGYAVHAAGAIAGLTSATTPRELVRAGLEAVSIEFGRIDRLLDRVMPAPERLVASGAALLHSPAWMQITADATGRTIATGSAKEASSRGAAIRALEGVGLATGEELKPALGRIYRPRRRATEAYRAEMARQEALYRVLITDRLLEKPPARRAAALQAAAGLG